MNSSLWTEPDSTRILFITLLAIADRRGVVNGSRQGISRIANIDHDDLDDAWQHLLSPDPDSSDRLRNPDNEGRRIEEIPGGFKLLNYEFYRGLRNEDDRREQNRQAQDRYVKKHKPQSATISHDQPRSARISLDEPPKPNSAHAEAEAEADADNTPPFPPPLAEGGTPATTRKRRKKPLEPTTETLNLVDHPELRPAPEQVDSYIAAKFPDFADGQLGSIFVAHYQENGWYRANGKPVIDWKATLYKNWIVKRMGV